MSFSHLQLGIWERHSKAESENSEEIKKRQPQVKPKQPLKAPVCCSLPADKLGKSSLAQIWSTCFIYFFLFTIHLHLGFQKVFKLPEMQKPKNQTKAAAVKAKIVVLILLQRSCSFHFDCWCTSKIRYSILQNRLVGLVVKASASRAEDPGFESRLRWDFSRSSHTSDLNLKTGIPVASVPDAWHYRVSAGTGWPGVSKLWLGEM